MSAARDLDLLRRWRDGDRDAGTELLREYKDGCKSLCRRFGLHGLDETVEVFQDVVLATIVELPTLPERIVKSFSGWFSWQVRAAISRRRKKTRAAAPGVVPDLPDEGAGPPEAAALREAIRRCSERLAPVEQQVFELRFVRGMSLKEAAAELGSNANAIGQNAFRLSRKMRACLEAAGFEGDAGGGA